VTLITGASSGIGAELARVFASKGHRLALVARRADRLQALAGEIGASGGAAPIVIPCDLEQADAGAGAATTPEDHAIAAAVERQAVKRAQGRRDRERKLLKKISQSLARLESGEYGFCDETGEPIGLGRLIARPTATLSLEAQQRRELKQKMFGD